MDDVKPCKKPGPLKGLSSFSAEKFGYLKEKSYIYRVNKKIIKVMFKTEELNELVSEYHNGSITLDEYWDKVHMLQDKK